MLQALVGGVLAGDRHLAVELVAFEDGDRGATEAVVGRDHAVDLAPVLVNICSKIVPALVLSQSGTAWSSMTV